MLCQRDAGLSAGRSVAEAPREKAVETGIIYDSDEKHLTNYVTIL